MTNSTTSTICTQTGNNSGKEYLILGVSVFGRKNNSFATNKPFIFDYLTFLKYFTRFPFHFQWQVYTVLHEHKEQIPPDHDILEYMSEFEPVAMAMEAVKRNINGKSLPEIE